MNALQDLLASGIAHKTAGEYDVAMRELEAVIAEDPECWQAHHELGLVLGFIGEFDRAVSELRTAVAIAPEATQPLLDLGLTLAMIGEDEQAKEAFENVLRLDPGNVTAAKNLSYFTS